MITLEIGFCTVAVYIPDEMSSRIVYLHASPEEGTAIWQRISNPKPILAVISGADWNRDFSPWPVPKVFARSEDFAGGAEIHLARLTSSIIPEVESSLSHPVSSRSIAGYSLAGLFALWCCYKADLFDAAACLSPSMWFDGFDGFMVKNTPSKNIRGIVMSLGDREKHTRNPRMSCIEDATLKAVAQLRASGVNVRFTFEHGGHFDDPVGRIIRGIDSLYLLG